MVKPGSIWMQNFQAMISSVCDSFYTNLLLEFLDASSRDNSDLAVRDVGQSFQNPLGLGGDYGKSWLLGKKGEGSVKIKNHAELGALIHQGAKILIKVPDFHFLYVLLCVFILMLRFKT